MVSISSVTLTKSVLERVNAVEGQIKSYLTLTPERALAQAEAAFKAADESLKKEIERLERSKYQIEKSKIYAPQDGMVAYASGSSRRYSVEICEGARVRLQQKILTLPNLSKMQVKTAVHE